MIDTDKYESMRQLFLDFIDTASDEVDEGAWKNKLTMLDELLEEVKRLREQVGNLSDKVVLLERAEATWYSMVADELDGDYND